MADDAERFFRTLELAKRDEHIRLFASYMNIVAAGAFVAAAFTVPLTVFATGKPGGWAVASITATYLVASALFHGVAQVSLTQVSS